MERFWDYARLLADGAPAPSATVTVYNQGTLVLASIFADNLGSPTPKANPFTADADAYFFFYAGSGRYDVRLSGGGIPTPYTWGDNVLSGLTSINGLTSDAITLVTGTSGTDFNIAAAGSTITLNLPNASATARGVVSTGAQTFAGVKTFSTPIAPGSGGTGLSAAPANGQLLIGSGGTAFVLATLTAGANIQVTNGAGTITLAATGVLTSLNGISAATQPIQTFAVGTAGVDFAIVSAGSVHTFNLPSASATARGVVTTAAQTLAGLKTFSSPPQYNAGTGSGVAVISGLLSAQGAAAANTGTAETDLHTFTLPANSLNVDGKALRLTAAGITAANANVKTIRAYLGATSVVVLTGALNGIGWRADVYILRAGGGGQRFWVVGTPTSGVINMAQVFGVENLATSLAVKITGQGGASSDITEFVWILEAVG
jgi:hypothetical protein